MDYNPDPITGRIRISSPLNCQVLTVDASHATFFKILLSVHRTMITLINLIKMVIVNEALEYEDWR